MKKTFKFLDEHIEEYFMGALLIGISCVMLAQIIMRFIGASIPWAEELSRYFYVWSVFLSISFTVKKRIVLRVDLLVSKLPKKLQKMVEILLQLVNIVLFLALAYFAIYTVSGVKLSSQTSPAMELPMYIVYMIIPISFFLTAIRCLQQIYFIITDNTIKPDTDYIETV